MNIPVRQIRSFADPKGILGKIVQFPLVRTVIALLFILVPMFLLEMLSEVILLIFEEPVTLWLRDLFAIVKIVVAISLYCIFTRLIEKRKALDVSLSGSVRETAVGVGLGAVIMTVMVALFWVLSYYRVESTGPLSVIIHAFFFFGFAAFIEEIVFRVILFRHVEELAGSWGAIIITGALFGLLHFGNPNATAWTSAAIALQSIILAGCFVLTRRVWLVWGIHVGWNYFQNAIYGVAVSGADDFESVLVPSINGPEWLTGGAFGIEGSYVTTALCFVIGFLLVMKASRSGQLVGPMWVRKEKAALAEVTNTEATT